MVAFETSYDKIIEVLGGKERVGMNVRSVSEVNKLIERGLAVGTFSLLAKQLELSEKELLKYIDADIPDDIFSSEKKNTAYLDSNISERLIKLAEIIYRGNEVFGKPDLFLGWLKTTPPVFEGESPIDYINTFTGQDYILTILGRIEHGVYS